ncbi:putative SOS response-associated peptidase YedK [Pedobacter sp. UYEF25]
MCYLVTQKSNASEISAYYDAPVTNSEEIEEMKTWFKADGFAHPKLMVLRDQEGKRELELQQWGLMPSWNMPMDKMLKLAKGTLNAKSETIRDLKSFKNSIDSKRCIIPVNNFFEYKHVKEEKEVQKLPYLIHPVEQPFFNLAGIYSHYKNPATDQWITSFSIVTEPANVFMAGIHNSAKRMPLMVSNELINDWINPSSPQKMVDEIMQFACDDSYLAAYRVRQDLKKAGNDESVMAQIES